MLHITFSGIDKSGKSTLINAFMIRTNYEHYVVDRDPSNYFFFNVIRDRLGDHEHGMKQLARYECFQKRFSKCVDLAILLYADDDDLIERFILNKEPDLVGDLTFEEHKKELELWFNLAKYKNTLKINTSKYSEEQCLNMIRNKIECL